MKRLLRRRLWAAGFAFILLLATTHVSTAASLVLSPDHGPAGTAVTVSGSGFQAGETVTIRWQTSYGDVLAAPTVDATGGFQAEVVTIPDSPPGTYTVWALGETSGEYTTSEFTVEPSNDVPSDAETVYLPLVTRQDRFKVLIANATAGDVTEVDRQGTIVWQLQGLDYPVDAMRLTNGNTLIADSGPIG